MGERLRDHVLAIAAEEQFQGLPLAASDLSPNGFGIDERLYERLGISKEDQDSLQEVVGAFSKTQMSDTMGP